MKTHENGLNWAKDIPTSDESKFGTDKYKSKETMDKVTQFIQTDRPAKIARMEPNSSKREQDTLPDVLDEIVKPKSLSELYVKRKHNEDDDEEDEQENVHDDDDDEENDDNEESGVK